MVSKRFGFLVVSSLVASAAVACSSTSETTANATADGDGSADGSTADTGSSASCALEPGPYTMHSVAADGGSECLPIQDTTVTIDADAGTEGPDAGSGCTTTNGPAACEVRIACQSTTVGYSSTTVTDIVFSSNSASGTIYSKSVDPDGGVMFDCVYAVTYTKQ